MDPTSKLEREAIYWHYPHYGNQGGAPSGGVRSGDWKLIEWFEDNSIELFNLADDVGEQHNLAAEQPDRTAAMVTRLTKWLEETEARMPTANPNFDPAAYEKQREHIRTKGVQALERQAARFLAADFVPDPTWWGSQPD